MKRFWLLSFQWGCPASCLLNQLELATLLLLGAVRADILSYSWFYEKFTTMLFSSGFVPTFALLNEKNPHISKLFSLSYMQISLLIFLSLNKYSFSLILCFCFWISKAYNCYMWRGSHVDEQVLQKCCWPFLRGGEGKEGEGRSKDWRISRQRLLGVSHWGLRASWNPDGLSSPYPSLHSLLLC